MPIFPLALTVLLDGQPVRGYTSPEIVRGQILTPVQPYITRLATSLEMQGACLIVIRGSRRTPCVILRNPQGGRFEGRDLTLADVPITPIAAALGLRVWYDAASGTLDIISPNRELYTPEPYSQERPQPSPAAVFTATPLPTPRPVWTGSPLPRRTPLPLASLQP